MNRQPIRVTRSFGATYNTMFYISRFCGWKDQSAQGLQHEQKNWHIAEVYVTQGGLVYQFRDGEQRSDVEIDAIRTGVMWLRGQPNTVGNLTWTEEQTDLQAEVGRFLVQPPYRLDMKQNPPRPIGA